MKDLSQKIAEINQYISANHIRSVSFDIDGTLYPLNKVKVRWWLRFFLNPAMAMKFLKIRKTWEKRRAGDQSIVVTKQDIIFFENFLASLLSPDLIPKDIKAWLTDLNNKNIRIFFLSDHGAEIKLKTLDLAAFGEAVNCLTATGELKPHAAISNHLVNHLRIVATEHLHLGDRWTDEAQAKLMNASFMYLMP
jgi:FMN phosphatase YigB (HAD superfamily)